LWIAVTLHQDSGTDLTPLTQLDLDVVSLGLQVVDGGTGRLGAGYRPHRLGGGDGHVSKG
jgi:hypothetical protein